LKSRIWIRWLHRFRITFCAAWRKRRG